MIPLNLHVEHVLLNDQRSDSLERLISSNFEMVWGTVLEDAAVIIVFRSLVCVEELEIQFWTSCFPSDITVYTFDEREDGSEVWERSVNTSVNQSDSKLSPRIKISCLLPPTKRLKIILSHGHRDPFYNHYSLAISRLALNGFIHVPQPVETEVLDEIVPETLTQSEPGLPSQKRMAPLFAFPDCRDVFKAFDCEREPWKQLSAGSKHREKLARRANHVPLRYFLPRFSSPTTCSIPSVSEIRSFSTR